MATDFDQEPHSETSLQKDMVTLGITPGMTLMVHSSLNAIGWAIGGAPSVVRALLAALGDEGTLAMPAATPHGHDPSEWPGPRPPEEIYPALREHLPVFDLATTPSAMGIITETLRTWPGTMRSNHPTSSVCARGPNSDLIVERHNLDFSEGNGTPFEALYELDSWTLLLGVGFNRCTFLHYAESLCDNRRTTVRRNLWQQDGRRAWLDMPDMADDNDTHFPLIGDQFLAAGSARKGRIGQAKAILFSTKELVDFAKAYFDRVL